MEFGMLSGHEERRPGSGSFEERQHRRRVRRIGAIVERATTLCGVSMRHGGERVEGSVADHVNRLGEDEARARDEHDRSADQRDDPSPGSHGGSAPSREVDVSAPRLYSRRHEQGLSLLLGIRDRGPPRQARRPDLRRRVGRDLGRGSRRTSGVRDARHDGSGHGGRRDLHLGVRRHPGGRAPDDHRDRLHGREVRPRRRDVRRHHGDPGAVARHRPRGRRRARAPRGSLRRRPRRARRRATRA